MLRPGGMAELHRRPSVYDSSFSRIYDHIDTYDPTSGGTKARRGSRDGDDHRALPDPITGVLWGQSAFQQICTLWFWLPQLFLICYMLRINYEIATVYDQVYYYTSDADLAQKITDAFVILLPLGGVIAIPFIGFLLDKRSSMAAFVALLVLGLGYGILCMLDSVPAQLLGILMFTIMRPLMCVSQSCIQMTPDPCTLRSLVLADSVFRIFWGTPVGAKVHRHLRLLHKSHRNRDVRDGVRLRQRNEVSRRPPSADSATTMCHGFMAATISDLA